MKIQVTNITLMDEVETQEAQMLLRKAKQKYIWLIILPVALFLVFAILMFTSIPFATLKDGAKLTTNFYVYLSLSILWLVAIFVGASMYNTRMQIYNKLLQVAQINDKIRHEEKIRFSERERLNQLSEHGLTKKYNAEKVDETLKNINNFLNNRK